jgi:hypothetical protein
MDGLHRNNYFGDRLGIARHREMSTRESAMKPSIHAPLTAIGRQLQAEYSPTVGQPLPGELKDLLARLVALDAGKRGPTERSVEVPQAASHS